MNIMNLDHVKRDTVGWFCKPKLDARGQGPFDSKQEATKAGLADRNISKRAKFYVEARRPEPFDFNDVACMQDILQNYAIAENPSDDSYPEKVFSNIHKTVDWDYSKPDGICADEELRKFFQNLVDNHGLWAWGGDWGPAFERYEIPVVRTVTQKKVVVARDEVSVKAGPAKQKRIVKKGGT